ncbi:predicted DNA-binding protein with PD1-like motif [Cereibacter ovatus]|uniref:Predicted DNA-binding protein with PD1-like motif n=2 Tax=Cereibacter ovatus TaxID=439529 RepID=A0A285CUT1_9RHOB|nr:predicted DNA-binding protein with PD1-like motif [Cereibacter ovatus]
MIHPGPRAEPRQRAVRSILQPIRGPLCAGRTVLRAVDELFAASHCKGGVLYLNDIACDPLRYVLPALSSDGVHAAWYSGIHDLGAARILRATASVGQRDGAAFLHCHGIWQGTDGSLRMGHLLPQETVIALDATAHGLGSDSAWFEGLPCAETAFTLFTPQGGTPEGTGLLARILPGEDVVTAIETLCAHHGLRQARLHGLGSIDHIRFAEGHRMDCLATELRLAGAHLRDGRAHLPIEVVDIAGRIAHGTLTRGDNPVGVTLELVIEPLE